MFIASEITASARTILLLCIYSNLINNTPKVRKDYIRLKKESIKNLKISANCSYKKINNVFLFSSTIPPPPPPPPLASFITFLAIISTKKRARPIQYPGKTPNLEFREMMYFLHTHKH